MNDNKSAPEMKEDKSTSNQVIDRDQDFEDLEIEAILKPRSEFHISADFKQKIMEEAVSTSARRRRRRIPILAAAASAAAIAVLVVLTVIHGRHSDPLSDLPSVAEAVDLSSPLSSDTLLTPGEKAEEDRPPVLIADNLSQPQKKNNDGKVAQQTPKRPSSKTFHRYGGGREKKHDVIDGALPMISVEKIPDPEEVRLRRQESRYNSEMAYIESIRNEIESNQAYIEQLMADENVLQ